MSENVHALVINVNLESDLFVFYVKFQHLVEHRNTMLEHLLDFITNSVFLNCFLPQGTKRSKPQDNKIIKVDPGMNLMVMIVVNLCVYCMSQGILFIWL